MRGRREDKGVGRGGDEGRRVEEVRKGEWRVVAVTTVNRGGQQRRAGRLDESERRRQTGEPEDG